MPRVTLEQLLAAGAHFGHLTRRWDPKMREFIFMERNGIHIIDLKKTQAKIDEACNAIQAIVEDGYEVLFVGTKKQAKEIIRTEAERSGMFYVTERWLGGTLTNFSTIKKSIKHLKNLEKMANDGTYDKISKKEILQIEREKEKLKKVLSGIEEMKRLPGAVFIVDTKKENIAVRESKKLNIPVFAIVDSNSDPTVVDYPIPANDDAAKSISIISRSLADAIIAGRQKVNEKKAEAEAIEAEKEKIREELKKEEKAAAAAVKQAKSDKNTKSGKPEKTVKPKSKKESATEDKKKEAVADKVKEENA